MSWSLRLLKLYSELNIETIIIDKRSFEGNLLDKFDIIFNNELNINLLLADSKHWQFVQDYTNGKLLNKNLLEYISNLNSNEFIYSGDAEHFGVNLGRFHFERDEVINKLIAFKSILKKIKPKKSPVRKLKVKNDFFKK